MKLIFIKKKLIELDKMGYKRVNYNLKTMISFREGDDVSKAFEFIKLEEERRLKNKKKKFERKSAEKEKKKKKKVKNKNLDEEEDDDNVEIEKSEKSDSNESDKSEDDVGDDREMDQMFVNFDSWPKNTFTNLIINGDQMNRNKNIIIAALECFCSTEKFNIAAVIFDDNENNYEKILDNTGTKFMLMGASKEKDSKCLIKDLYFSLPEDMRSKCLIVSTQIDENLRKLKQKSVMRCSKFIELIIKTIDGKNTNVDEWFNKIEANLST